MLLNGLDKIHIFRARFHSSAALSDAFLFEVESPEDKEDLIRLDDDYGREKQGYEGREFFEKKTEKHFWLKEPEPNASGESFYGCLLRHLSVESVNELDSFDEHDVLVFTRGGILTNDEKKNTFSWRYSGRTYPRKNRAKFNLAPDTSIIHLRKYDN